MGYKMADASQRGGDAAGVQSTEGGVLGKERVLHWGEAGWEPGLPSLSTSLSQGARERRLPGSIQLKSSLTLKMLLILHSTSGERYV